MRKRNANNHLETNLESVKLKKTEKIRNTESNNITEGTGRDKNRALQNWIHLLIKI